MRSSIRGGLSSALVVVFVSMLPATEAFACQDLAELPRTNDTVMAAVSYATRTHDVAVFAQCGGNPQISCPGGIPSDPSSFSISPRGIAISGSEAAGFSYTANVVIKTSQPIPFTTQGASCGLSIDTTPGASSTVVVSGNAIFSSDGTPGSTANRFTFGRLTVTGLEAADISISGDFNCTFTILGTSWVDNLIQFNLQGDWSSGVCRECGSTTMSACPAARRAEFHGDFDGDGRDDLLLRNSATGEVSVWLMNGTSKIGGGSVGWIGNNAIAGIGDFNGDKRADILFRDSLGNLGMWLMNGATVIAGAYVGSPAGSTVAAVADFDGDGRADILLRDARGNLGVWLMNGSTITGGGFVGSAAGYNVAAARDFNGDGKADILLRDDYGNLGLWMMNGSSIIAGGFVGSPGAYSVAGANDFNGDGKADILLRDSLGNLGMWLMNGSSIVSGGFVGSPGNYSVVSVGNYDGNGKADILLRDAGGTLGMWLMNGTSIQGGGAVSASPGSTYEVH